MKVEVVGTSCTWFTRLNTSFIIDDEILFDVPAGNYKQIIKSIDVFKLKWIFISHFHIDHAADLRTIAIRFMREGAKMGRTEKLKIYAPKGLPELLVKQNELFLGAEDERSIEEHKGVIDFIEVCDGMEFEEGNYKVKVVAVEHSVETYGLIFTQKSDGKVISFSADTTLCEALPRMLEVSDFAFVDMGTITTSKSHLGVDNFVSLAEKYKNCKMFPVHTCDKSQQFAEENGLNFLHDGDVLKL